MAGTVTIPFRKRLEVGDTRFKINIPRKLLNDPKRTFGFQRITLLPEYQSQQAYAYNMDPKSELDMEVKNDFLLEINYSNSFYTETAAWTFSPTLTTMGALLKSLNMHFDSKKPQGTLISPVIFDWMSIDCMGSDDIRQFHRERAETYYGEPYNASKHSNFLPPSATSILELNNMAFPTIITEDLLDLVRIRMFVAPNVTVAFSNEFLPTVLGFSSEQIPARSKRNQVPFVNTSLTDFESFYCLEPIINTMPIELKMSKVHVYTTSEFVVSPLGNLSTTKRRERNYEFLAEDYSNAIGKLAKKMNLYMALEYVKAEKKFKLIYPTNNQVSINIKTKPYICRQLGFEASDVIKHKAVPSVVSNETDVKEIEQKARALVYDTGMVVVDLNQQMSQQNSYSGTITMATLEPVFDGVMRCPAQVEMPRVNVTYFDPQLEFVLYRIGDDGEPHPLEWNVGAFIQGLFVGKV